MGATTIVLTLFLAVVSASFAVCGGSRWMPSRWNHGRSRLVAGTIPVTFLVSDDIPREGPNFINVRCPPQFNNIDGFDYGTGSVNYLGNTALTPGMSCTAVLYYLKAEFGIHWSDVPSNAAAVHWKLSMDGVSLSFDNVSWQKVSSWAGQ